MLIVYRWDEETGTVVVVTIQDARSSDVTGVGLAAQDHIT
jgi:hypothetical protein